MNLTHFNYQEHINRTASAIVENILLDKYHDADSQILIWIREQVLKILSNNPIHIPPPYLCSLIHSEWIRIKSERVQPKNEQIVEVSVLGKKTINQNELFYEVCIKNTDNKFIIQIPHSLLSYPYLFLQNTFVMTFESQRTIQNIMLQPKCFVIELDKESYIDLQSLLDTISIEEDLSAFTRDSPPTSFIVQILDELDDGFCIGNDFSPKTRTLFFHEQFSAYRNILKVGDVLMIINLVCTIDDDNNQDLLCPDENTIFIRFKRSSTSIAQDIEVSGVVLDIKHSFNSYGWNGCQISIQTDDGETIGIQANKFIASKYKSIFYAMKTYHYVWFFHCLSDPLEVDYQFSHHSSVYDLNMIQSFYESLIVPKIPICFSSKCSSLIVRAVILSMEIKKVTIHNECESILVQTHQCPKCSHPTDGRVHETLFFDINLDDGTGTLQVYALLDHFFISHMSIDDFNKKELTQSQIRSKLKEQEFRDDQIRRLLEKPKAKISSNQEEETTENNTESSSNEENDDDSIVSSDDDSDQEEIERLRAQRFKKAQEDKEQKNIDIKSSDLYVQYQNCWDSKFHRLIGSEFIFMLSQCDGSETNFESNSLFRVDYCSKGENETTRTISDLIDYLSE